MPEHIRYEEDDLFNPETQHESSDVPVTGLLWFVVIFLVFSLVSHFVILFMYKGFVRAEARRMDPPQTTVKRSATADVPQNQPLLQPFPRRDGEGQGLPPQGDTPVSDLQKMRDAEKLVLDHYGWVDRQHGVVHIPIEQAKQLVAARLAAQSTTVIVTPGALGVQPPPPGSTASPAGTPVPPDTGAIQPGTKPPAPAASTTTSTTQAGGAR